jgi:hypothetical protein
MPRTARRIVDEIVDHRNGLMADRLLQVVHKGQVNILSKVPSRTQIIAHGLVNAPSTVVGQVLGTRRRGGDSPSER